MTTMTRSSKTQLALLWMHLTSEPLFALRSALTAYILYSDFGASMWQLGLCHAIRPVVSLLSFYWGANLQPGKLRNNLIGGWLLARLPFVFILFVDNTWYLLMAETLFWGFHRASIPALMEILKINMGAEKRSQAVALSFALKFIESIFLGLIFAAVLMKNPSAWRGLYCLAALISITSVFWQKRIPLPSAPEVVKKGWRERLIDPWKKTVELMRTRPDFYRFQEGFMYGGFGLMLISPVITIYTVDTLGATHANVLLGRSVCMGVGVIAAITIWRKLMMRVDLVKLLGAVIVGFAIYPFTMLMAQFHFTYYYLAFFLYGVAQAGSHLLWHLSGPLFARDGESASFSAVNVLTVGLRGLIAPALGSVLCVSFGPVPVLILGAVVLGFGAWRMLVDKSVQVA